MVDHFVMRPIPLTRDDATLAEVEELGGTTVRPRQEVGQMGFTAYFTDPEGNLTGLWQSAPQNG